MYKLKEFIDMTNLINDNSKSLRFLDLLTRKWDQLHEDTDVFRYKIINLEERLEDGKYLLQLNPDRQSKRRMPEDMNSICQPFDGNKFNFTKVSPNEILLTLEDSDLDHHTFLVNVSPISKYHSLLCPSIHKGLPQVITAESLQLVLDIMFIAQDRDVKMGFNSLCALASVNHLHYHFFVEMNILPVERVKWIHIKDSIHKLDNEYPVPAFCFAVPKQSIREVCRDIYKLVEHFLKKSIAHNILLTRRRLQGDDKEAAYVIVWPRKSTTGVKKLAAFNVAVLELSGWFPVYATDDFKNLNTSDLEMELKKWKFDNFEGLCEEIKCIY